MACTIVSALCAFGAFYCLVARLVIPLFVLAGAGIVTGVLRMYYKNQRLRIINSDKVAIETLSKLNKR